MKTDKVRADNNITVALIGIPGIEQKRLNAAFQHSQSRHTAYSAVAVDNSPQILMVNADVPSSLIQWRRYRDTLEARPVNDPPSILVSEKREFQTKHYQIRRPLIVSRAISILDQVTAKEFAVNEEIAVLEQTATPVAYRSEEEAVKKAHIPNKSVALVIDDSLPVRIQMDQVLKPFTERVDFAESGEEAFALIDKNEYQIIFLDIILPGMDGYEICKVLKQGKAKNTPVIMLTGNSSPVDKIKGKLAGCDTYLIKPVGQTIFKEVVSQYLGSSVTPAAITDYALRC